jgi:hypothetical protein
MNIYEATDKKKKQVKRFGQGLHEQNESIN